MNFSYNGSQYPFPWQNLNYIANGYNGNQQHHHAGTAQPTPAHAHAPPPPPPPPPHGAPPGYHVPSIPATQGMASNAAGGIIYPFPVNSAPYATQSPAFDANWQYNYNNCVSRFADMQHHQTVVNRPTVPAGNSVMPINVSTSSANEIAKSSEQKSESVGREASDKDFTEEIALKVSSLLTDSNIFKTAMSKLQKPNQCDKTVLYTPIENTDVEFDASTDQVPNSSNVLDNSTADQNVTVR